MKTREWLALYGLVVVVFSLTGLGIAAVRHSWLVGVTIGLPLFLLAALTWRRLQPRFESAMAWLRSRG